MRKSILIFLIISLAHLLHAQIIFEEGFENNNTNGNPPQSWICDADGWMAGEGVQNHNREAHTGDWYAYLNWDSDQWMYKAVTLEAGETYEFSLFYRTDGATGFSFEVSYGTEANPGAMQNEIFPLAAVENESYLDLLETFVCNTSDTYFVGIHGIADNNPWYLTIDDIKLRKVNEYGFQLDRLNADTLIYAGDTHDYLIQIENTGLNEDQIGLSVSSDWEANFFNEDGSGPISSIDLASFDSKNVILRQTIPATGIAFGETQATTTTFASSNSSDSYDLIFTSTALTSYGDFPLTEGFDDVLFPPLGWLNSIENGDANFERSTLGEYPTCIPHDNSDGMAFYQSFSAQPGESAFMISPELDLSNEEFIVRFWIYRTDNINTKADKIEVWLSDDMELNSAELLGTVHRTISMEPIETSEAWFEYSYIFDGNNEKKYIIFRAVSDYGWNMYLDDIKVDINGEDTEAPEFISINELIQYADFDIPVEIVIRDDSEVTENMQGIYNVGNGEETFELSLGGKSKGDFTYIGNIPAQPDQTTGTVKFVMEDIYGNTAETDEFAIEWSGIAPLLEESFENDFLPNGWTQIMQPYTWFVWSKVNEEDYTDSDGVDYVVTPPDGEYQAMVGWDWQGNAQDEWLISPEVDITEAADLKFETFAQIGSYDYDHFIVAISTNGGASWTDLWDAFYMDNRVIQYDETIEIPLDDYVGQSIKVAWRAYNQMYDNLWYSWFIDDVKIEKRTNVGVENESLASFKFSVFNNPFQDHLDLKLFNSSKEKSQIRITNLNGQIILEQEFYPDANTDRYSINTTTLKAGVYICSVIQNGEVYSELVVKH